MSDLYMIRAYLRHDASGSDGALIRLLAGARLDPNQIHHLVWTLFGDDPDRDRDFVFRIERRYGRPMVLAYAPRPPRTDGVLWRVDAKPFVPDLRAGDPVRFRVRVNPVKQIGRARIDVVYDAVREERARGGDKNIDRDAVARRAGEAWFRERAPRWGLALEDMDERPLSISGYHNEPMPGGRMRLSTLEVEGVAHVADAEALRAAIRNGCGRAKAYGCGMLLLARARTLRGSG